jgi:hypothetical protein
MTLKFTFLQPGLNVINLFLSVIYGFLYLPRVFVRIDQKSLLIANTLAYYKNLYIKDKKVL